MSLLPSSLAAIQVTSSGFRVILLGLLLLGSTFSFSDFSLIPYPIFADSRPMPAIRAILGFGPSGRVFACLIISVFHGFSGYLGPLVGFRPYTAPLTGLVLFCG